MVLHVYISVVCRVTEIACKVFPHIHCATTTYYIHNYSQHRHHDDSIQVSLFGWHTWSPILQWKRRPLVKNVKYMYYCPQTHATPLTPTDCSYQVQMQQQALTVRRHVSSPEESCGCPQSAKTMPPEHRHKLETQMSEQKSSWIFFFSHQWDCHESVYSDVKDHHSNTAQSGRSDWSRQIEWNQYMKWSRRTLLIMSPKLQTWWKHYTYIHQYFHSLTSEWGLCSTTSAALSKCDSTTFCPTTCPSLHKSMRNLLLLSLAFLGITRHRITLQNQRVILVVV